MALATLSQTSHCGAGVAGTQGNLSWKTYLVVEVARSPRNVGYAAKAIMKAFNFEPTMEEGFIFNYQKNEWIRYSRLENGEIVAEKADWSRVLNRFLDPLTRVSDTDWDELKL